MRISSIRMNTNSAIISSLSGHRAGQSVRSGVKKSVFAKLRAARSVRRQAGREGAGGLTEDHHDSTTARAGGPGAIFPGVQRHSHSADQTLICQQVGRAWTTLVLTTTTTTVTLTVNIASSTSALADW